MSATKARRLAKALAAYTLGPKINSDGTYTIGNCDPDPTCASAAAMLCAQAGEIERLTAERLHLSDAGADHWSLRRIIDAELGCQADGQDADATIEAIRALLAERDSLRAELAALMAGRNNGGWLLPGDADPGAAARWAKISPPAVPDEWLAKVHGLVQGFEHVSGIARLWEPDYSDGRQRALWARATEACADVAKMLRSNGIGQPAKKDPCTWSLDDDPDRAAWQSACGQSWMFTDGGPAENHVRYCHGCGRPVQIVQPAEAPK